MSSASIYLILFLVSGGLNFIFAMIILRELSAGQGGLRFFDLRWHVLKNLGRYRDLTRSKYGRTGFAYYGYLASFGILLLMAVLLLSLVGR